MNRLQKKCFIGSAGCHLLLAVILLVGPAFLSSKSQVENVPPLAFVPSRLVEAALMGGGNPTAKPPPAAPPAPAIPQAAPPPVAKTREPEPSPDPVKPKPETESLEVSKPHKPRMPQVSTTPVIRKTSQKPPAKETPEIDPRVQQFADARRQAAKQIRSAAEDFGESSSPRTLVADPGPGGGGPSYASYGAWVRTVYENAWSAPEDAATDHGVAKVSVTIARDGSVISAQIINRSGDAQLDASVRRALDRITSIGRPFPEGDKENERTYIIPFDLKVKRGQA